MTLFKKNNKDNETEKKATKHYYFVNSDGNIKRCALPKTEKIKQDSVVDYSSFRPDNEEERIFRLTGQGGSGNVGKYDDEDKMPSDIVVQIRQGKLDKAEVQQALEDKKEEFKKSQDEAKAEEAQKIAEARQEFLDKATGFEGKPQES